MWNDLTVPQFCNQYKALCICTLGLAIIGFLLGKRVQYLQKPAGTAEKVNENAACLLQREEPQEPPGALAGRVSVSTQTDLEIPRPASPVPEAVEMKKIETEDEQTLSPTNQNDTSNKDASQKTAEAFNELAQIGVGVKDYKKAAFFYECAAEKGDARACMILKKYYQKGLEVKQNKAKASEYWARALLLRRQARRYEM